MKNRLPIYFHVDFWLIVVLLIGALAFIFREPGAADSSSVAIRTYANNPIYIVTIAGTAIIVLMLTILTQKFNQNADNLDEKISEIKHLSKQIEQMKHTDDEYSEYFDRLNKIYNDYFQTLDALSAEYFEKNDAGPQIRLSIIRKLEDELSRMQSEEFDNSLIEWCNLNFNDILSNISTEMPQLKEHDLKLIGLKLAKFSAKSICLILQINLGNYYNRWGRLRTKIMQSNAPHKEELLKLLNAKKDNITNG